MYIYTHVCTSIYTHIFHSMWTPQTSTHLLNEVYNLHPLSFWWFWSAGVSNGCVGVSVLGVSVVSRRATGVIVFSVEESMQFVIKLWGHPFPLSSGISILYKIFVRLCQIAIFLITLINRFPPPKLYPSTSMAAATSVQTFFLGGGGCCQAAWTGLWRMKQFCCEFIPAATHNGFISLPYYTCKQFIKTPVMLLIPEIYWLVVFYVPWSSVNIPFPTGIEPRAAACQSITLPLHHASSTQKKKMVSPPQLTGLFGISSLTLPLYRFQHLKSYSDSVHFSQCCHTGMSLNAP